VSLGNILKNINIPDIMIGIHPLTVFNDEVAKSIFKYKSNKRKRTKRSAWQK
jgi:hypothetical protein